MRKASVFLSSEVDPAAEGGTRDSVTDTPIAAALELASSGSRRFLSSDQSTRTAGVNRAGPGSSQCAAAADTADAEMNQAEEVQQAGTHDEPRNERDDEVAALANEGQRLITECGDLEGGSALIKQAHNLQLAREDGG